MNPQFYLNGFPIETPSITAKEFAVLQALASSENMFGDMDNMDLVSLNPEKNGYIYGGLTSVADTVFGNPKSFGGVIASLQNKSIVILEEEGCMSEKLGMQDTAIWFDYDAVAELVRLYS